MTEIVDVTIGTCPECGHPIRTTEPRFTRRDGLLQHINCPLVTIREPDLGGDAA